MEDEIQAGEDGLYCVGFKNVYALSRERIHEEFSLFGRVRSVRGASDGVSTQWTFVRFSQPEEAVRAISGMRASPHLCNVNLVKYVQDSGFVKYVQDGGFDGRGRGRGRGRGADFSAAPEADAGLSPLLRGNEPPARSPVRPPAEQPRRPLRYEVFVGNWPHDLGEEDVYGLFAKFNIKTLDVRLYKKENKSYAFVVVSSAEDVARSIEQLNRGKVAGRQIVVKDSRNSFTKHQSPAAPAQQKPQHQQQHEQHHQRPQERQRHYQQPQHHHQEERQQQHRPAAVQQDRAPGSVRQRLGGPGWRGGAAPSARSAPDISRMPPLVMPPQEPMAPPPPPPAAPYRGAGGYPRGGGQFRGAGAGEQFNGPEGQFNGSGGQFNGSGGGLFDGGRHQFDDAGFDSDGAGNQFEEPDGQFASAGGQFVGSRSQFRGAAGLRGVPRASPSGPPPLAGLGRRSYSQRADSDGGYSEPYMKRGRFGEADMGGPDLLSGPPPLAGLGGLGRTVCLQPLRTADMPAPGALRSSKAISDRIKSRLHAPMDVVVANFPAGTNEHDLMELFRRFEPLNVRIMVNNSSQHSDDFTYAYVTVSSRMAADEAVMEMDGLAFEGRPLVVETRKN